MKCALPGCQNDLTEDQISFCSVAHWRLYQRQYTKYYATNREAIDQYIDEWNDRMEKAQERASDFT